jgi:uncharacterized membrane protein YfcA
MFETIASFFLSLTGNILASFAGGGGSLVVMSGLLILIPSMSYLSVLAITKTSAAVLTATSAFLHSEKQKIDWGMIFALIFPGLTGVALATFLVQHKIEEGLIVNLLPFLLFGLAIYLSFDRKVGVGESRKKAFTQMEYLEAALFSFAISILNGMMSGLGPFFVAYFLIRFKTSFIQTIAYMMISGVVINVLQASYLLWTVEVNLSILALVILGSVIGSYAGTKLQYKVGNKLVKPVALLLMVGLGVLMVIS